VNLGAALSALVLAVAAASPATVAGASGPSADTAAARATPKPKISWDPIPFDAQRKRDMTAYAQRHYGIDTYKLTDPKVIVEHYTESSTWQSAFNTFAPNVADSELGEKPGTCAHFVIDEKGVIHQLVSIKTMCRHTVGLNYTAIGIEHVGYSDAQVLGNKRQMAASLALTCWLRSREGISLSNVIGHNESLSSKFHRENVARLRTQTHDDFKRADMKTYRARVKATCGG
jgi:N-acetylmuramoyl-L-alanine amidase